MCLCHVWEPAYGRALVQKNTNIVTRGRSIRPHSDYGENSIGKGRKDENGMAKKQVVMTSGGVEVRHKPLGLRIWNNRGYYIMFLPVVIFMLIMNYWPMLGVRYAFYDYKPVGPKVFVGFDHFVKMFGTPAFWTAFKNTLELSIIKLIITNISAVVVSIFLNEKSVCKEDFADNHIFAALYVMGSSCINLQFVPFAVGNRYGKRYFVPR